MELFETRQQAPWNRNGTRDATEDWPQMSDAQIQAAAQAAAEPTDTEWRAIVRHDLRQAELI